MDLNENKDILAMLCMYTIQSKHTHAVIYITHKTFEPDRPRQQRCLHTHTKTNTHTETDAQTGKRYTHC